MARRLRRVWCKSSPYINHFLQPDTLIPDPANPQAWNRYSYVNNSPINYNDPTGHMCSDPEKYELGKGSCDSGNNGGGVKKQTKPATGTSGGQACTGENQSVLCLPVIPALPPLCVFDCLPPSQLYQGPFYQNADPVDPEQSELFDPAPPQPPISISVDWSNVDKVDMAIDIGGLVGDGAKTLGIPGAVAYGISEVAEGAGAGKAIWDIAVNQDPSNFSLYTFQKQLEAAGPHLFPDVARTHPTFGFFFNVFSLAQNILPATTIKINK